MTWQTFWIYYLLLMVGMLTFRCVPMFVLKGRVLPERVHRILSLIPAAAFAALVANDLFSPDLLATGLVPALIPLIAALIVAAVALKTGSLVASALTGIVVYSLLTLIV